MISIKRLAALVSVLLVSIVNSRLTQCQLTDNDFTPNDLYQLGVDTRYEGPSASLDQEGSYYQNSLQDPVANEDDDDLISSLANELLEARRRQASIEPESNLEQDQDQERDHEEQVQEQEDNMPISALLDQLSNQKRQLPSSNPGYYYYDINSHLPASSLDDEIGSIGTISKPVNDPEEYEAKLSQLTAALNHNMANTKDRQELLLGLLNRTNELESTQHHSIDSLNSISKLEMDRLVGELGKLLEDQANEHREQQERDDNEANRFELANSLSRYGGSEYIDDPLALFGHQYVQGGAGEGRQLLGPDGTYENVQVIKTDSAIPSYCDPPNPCPIGYTAKDGCLENFVNSASFSREYQAQQKCSCDNEHSLFNCASPMSSQQPQQQSQQQKSKQDSAANVSGDVDSSSSSLFTLSDKLDTLARTIQNRFGDLASIQRLIGKQQKNQESDPNSNIGQNALLTGNDDADPNYLVRSARKLSSLDMHHKVDLD